MFGNERFGFLLKYRFLLCNFPLYGRNKYPGQASPLHAPYDVQRRKEMAVCPN
jgi:hypothetical protein